MKKNIRIAIAQINCTVGDLDNNAKKVIDYASRAQAAGADIAIFPELVVTGYPPEDLLLKPKFISDNLETIKQIARRAADIIVVAGFVSREANGIYNSAAIMYKGRITGIYNKMFLPNYGVFDEKRYFLPGVSAPVFKAGDLMFGVNICEDIWHADGPVNMQAKLGAELIININSSPFHVGKIRDRENVIKGRARENKAYIAYANLVGGQDELVFDGRSMVVGPDGTVLCRAEAFKEDLLVADIELRNRKTGANEAITVTKTLSDVPKVAIQKKTVKQLTETAEVYQALVLGLSDYVRKNGFKKVVIGLSGGIDSALVATLAADAIAAENVTCVFMPTRYSSRESGRDARELSAALGVKMMNISIDHIYKLYLLSLEPVFVGARPDITEENIQARIRGNILMALSNKFGYLVLTTGNKSEMSTGYATLYGDMAGGLAVIKDVPKTMVYKLVKYRNSLKKVIPDAIITKEPTAELRHDQKDSDSLPPYKTLDEIVRAYVEEDRSPREIVAMGFNKDTVSKVINLVDKSEYKRRQSPPGIKITPKAFGKDRRMPITNKYK